MILQRVSSNIFSATFFIVRNCIDVLLRRILKFYWFSRSCVCYVGYKIILLPPLGDSSNKRYVLRLFRTETVQFNIVYGYLDLLGERVFWTAASMQNFMSRRVFWTFPAKIEVLTKVSHFHHGAKCF